MLKNLTAALCKYSFNLSDQNIMRYYHRKVSANCREFGNAFILSVEGCERYDRRHIQHCYISSCSDVVVFQYKRMYLSQVAKDNSVIYDVCLSARMQERLACLRIIFFLSCHADCIKEFLYNTLHRKEITVSVHTECHLHSFIRKLCQRQLLCDINVCHFKQLYVFISSVVICCKTCQHTIQGCCSHD